MDYLGADDDQATDDMAYLTTVEARLHEMAPAAGADAFLTYLSI